MSVGTYRGPLGPLVVAIVTSSDLSIDLGVGLYMGAQPPYIEIFPTFWHNICNISTQLIKFPTE